MARAGRVVTRLRRVLALTAVVLGTAITPTACAEDPVRAGPDLEAASQDQAVSPGPGEPFTLRVDQTVEVEGTGLSIRLLAVLDDSRCPADVTCVWAGDAVVAVEVALGGERRAYGLHVNPGTATGPGEADVGAYRVVLLGLAPAPLAGVPIPQAGYVATLRVEATP